MGDVIVTNHWKERYWICDNCGSVYRRYIKDKRSFHCGRLMRSARKYPNANFFRSIQKKCDRKFAEQDQLNKKYSRVWNSEGHILQTSKETRKIWKIMSRLKHRDAFVRHGLLLLESLRKDLGQFGSQGVPAIVYKEMGYQLGVYRRSLLHGYWEIALTPSHDITEIMDTFLHEVLHWIDDQSRSHHKFGTLPADHFQFEQRLSDLKLRLGVKKGSLLLPLKNKRKG